MHVLKFIDIDKIGAPAEIESDYLPGSVDGWIALYQRWGMIRPLFVNYQTGQLLSAPFELDALRRLRSAGELPPQPVIFSAGAIWRAPCYLLDIPQDDQDLVRYALAGGTDYRLTPRFRDEPTIRLLLDACQRDFKIVNTFGMSLDELGEVLDTISQPINPPIPAGAIPPTAPAPSLEGWGIPMLDPGKQVTQLLTPFKWGEGRRADQALGDRWVHFYTEDKKFSKLLHDASALIRSAPGGMCELNISTAPDMPPALVLYHTYQKRLVSATAQHYGIPVMVDLNVERAFTEINMLGIPAGWRAYCNRGRADDLEHLDLSYERARAQAGSDDVFYVVYGGGAAVRKYAAARGWQWVMERADEKRGRPVGTAKKNPDR